MKNPFRSFCGIITFLCLFLFAFSLTTKAQKELPAGKLYPVIPSLNAYSFNDLLLGKTTSENHTAFTLFDLLDWCAKEHIRAVDLTGYYFPGYPEVPSDEYIRKIREKAATLGIAISGTGIRNNFANPDPAARKADVELAKKWIVVASKLGAPVIRLFAGAVPQGYEDKWDEVAAWMIGCFKECAAYGEQYGVKIGIQNHGDMLQTAGQCLKVIKGIDSKWAGIIVDTGSFKTADPYVDIEAAAPYAVNWQVKESVFGSASNIHIDCIRLIKIIKKTSYRGYLPVETLVFKGKPYDPFTGVPQLLKELNAAIKEAF